MCNRRYIIIPCSISFSLDSARIFSSSFINLSFCIRMACSHLKSFSPETCIFFQNTCALPKICLAAPENTASVRAKTAQYSLNLSKVHVHHWGAMSWWSILRLEWNLKADFSDKYQVQVCTVNLPLTEIWVSLSCLCFCCYHNPGVRD